MDEPINDTYEITEEQVQAMLFANACPNNVGVVCVKNERKPGQCKRCGWNPLVTNQRKRRIRKEFSKN